MWKSTLSLAEHALADSNYDAAIAAINSLKIAELPTVARLDDLPYHLLSDFLVRLPKVEGEWLFGRISPALLKWMCNQGLETCPGIPYIARHVGKFFSANPDRFEAYRDILDTAITLFSFGTDVSTAEATVICQSANDSSRERIFQVLDEKFDHLNYEQCNYIFGYMNRVPVEWFRSRRSDLLKRGGAATTMLNITRLCAAYSDLDSLDYCIQRPSKITSDSSELAREIIKDNRASKRRPRTPLPSSLNIALCVSGQLRGYAKARTTWNALGLQGHNITTFVHVWDSVGRKIPHPNHSTRSFSPRFAAAFSDYVMTYGEDAFWERYPNIKTLFSQADSISAGSLAEFYDTDHVVVESEALAPFAFHNNTERLHYKVKACHDLMKADGQHFDLVIRIRPDKSLREGEPLDLGYVLSMCSEQRSIYVDDANFFLPAGGLAFCDQIAIGMQQDMDIYASVWTNYLRRKKNVFYPGEKVGDELFPHTNLAHDCLLGGVTARSIRDISDIVGEPLDPDMIDQKLLKEAVLSTFPSAPNLYDEILLRAFH